MTRIDDSEILIRAWSSDDVVEVARLFRASRQSALSFLPDLHTADEDTEFFRTHVFGNDDVFVAISNSAQVMLGFIAIGKAVQSPRMIDHLYVLPGAQHKGIGSLLLAKAKQSANSLELWCFQRNVTARRFYEKHGFSILKMTDGSENEEKEPDILYGWTA